MKLFAANVLLPDGWAENKTLVIENGFIKEVVNGKQEGADEAKGPIVPGMVNIHSHAFQKAFVGLTEFQVDVNDSFWSWRDAMYRLLQCIQPDDLKVIADYLYMEMLKNGYTSCAEFHYLHHQYDGDAYDDPAINSKMLIESAHTTGMALCLSPVFYHYANFNHQPAENAQRAFKHSVESYQALMEELRQLAGKSARLTLGIAPHSLRAVSSEQLDLLTHWWREKNVKAPIHLHIAEQMKEVNECEAFYGQRPVEWLLEHFPVDKHWCLVHATHLNDDEIKALAKSKALAGICPQTEANLGDGIFPCVEFIQHHGRFGIGSDSHIAVSPWQELRLLEYSQRLRDQKRNRLCTAEVPHVGEYLWRMCAEEGASVIQQNVGRIENGYRADLLVLDGSQTGLKVGEAKHWLDAAIFGLNDNPVRDVMVNGEWRIVDRNHAEQESIVAQYQSFLQTKVRHL